MIVNEFLEIHSLFLREAILNIMVSSESIHKLLVAIFSRSKSTDNIRMAGRIEARLHLIEINDSILILIQSSKSLSHNVGTVCIQFTKYSNDKFFNANLSVSVVIKYGKDLISLRPSAPNPVIIECTPELPEVQRATPISIHYFKLAL